MTWTMPGDVPFVHCRKLSCMKITTKQTRKISQVRSASYSPVRSWVLPLLTLCPPCFYWAEMTHNSACMMCTCSMPVVALFFGTIRLNMILKRTLQTFKFSFSLNHHLRHRRRRRHYHHHGCSQLEGYVTTLSMATPSVLGLFPLPLRIKPSLTITINRKI